MATTWGAYVGGLSPQPARSMRVGWQYTQTPSTVTSATTSVSITITHRFMTYDWDVNDTSNTFQVTGYNTVSARSVTINNGTGVSWPGGAEKVIYTQTFTVNLNYGSTQALSLTSSLSGIDTIGSYTAAEGISITIPARPYGVPSTPGFPSATGITQTSVSTAWTATTDWGGNTGNYRVQISTDTSFIGGLQESLQAGLSKTFSGLTGNTPYYIRVRAENLGGNSAWSSRRDFTTSPLVPGTAGQPTISSIGTTTATANWAAPSNWNGDISNDYDIGITPSGGSETVTEVLNTTIKAFSGLTANTVYSVRVRAKNVAGPGPWSTVRGFTTAPDIVAAPTGVTATRVSDTQHNLAWTRNATTGAPYDSQTVLRSKNGAAYAAIATLAGTATSYSDIGTVADADYRWQIRATNTGGSATSTATANMQTTPAAPGSVTANKQPNNDILVTWANLSALTPITWEVEESSNSGSTWTVKATGIAQGTLTYTDVAPNTSVLHRYRVRAKSTEGATTWSPYVSTTDVQLAAPPNAPSNLAPDGVSLDAANNIVFTWTHNPVDSSAQSAFDVRHRYVGNPVWTDVSVVSTASTWTLPGGTYSNGQSIEWQVRTKGIDPTAGAYSATATFVASTPPTVNISNPVNGVTFGLSTISVTWVYYDAEGTNQAQWRARLILAGTIVESRSGANTLLTTTFDTSLEDDTTYVIEVEAQDGSGLWSTVDSVSVPVDYLPPVAINTTAYYDRPTGTVSLTLFPEAINPGVTVAATSARVERRINGGDWHTIALSIPPDAAIVDTQPTTRGLNEYRVTGISDTPSTFANTITSVTTDEHLYGFLSTGVSFQEILRVECDPGEGATTGRARAVRKFAGRKKGVLLTGESESQIVRVTGTTLAGVTERVDLEEMARTDTLVLWRSPTGRRVYGGMGDLEVEVINMARPDVCTLAFSVEEVDYVG